MTDKDRGHLAVGHYMLCELCAVEEDHANAFFHWKQGETIRSSIPRDILEQLEWNARKFARTSMQHFDQDLQECHNCRQLVMNPKKCSACKVAVYCSRDCQSAAWKSGHKRECKQLTMKIAATKETPVPVDANLEARKLWTSGNKLVRDKGDPEEAVFQYLVALFMDFSLDAQDKTFAKKALARCDKHNPMAIAFGLLVNVEQLTATDHLLEACDKARDDIEQILRDNPGQHVRADGVEIVSSLEEVDRFQFGVAMSLIFRGRIIRQCYELNSFEQAVNKEVQDSFYDVVRLFSEAGSYISSDCWLTYQCELGYSNLDVMEVDEAKRWLVLFLGGLERVEQETGSLNRHWKKWKTTAEQKRAIIPLMDVAVKLRGRQGL